MVEDKTRAKQKSLSLGHAGERWAFGELSSGDKEGT